MNDLMYNQLKKVKKIALPEYDKDTTYMLISRDQSDKLDFMIGRAYILQLEDYIINPPNGFNLHANWNKGIAPKDKYLYALIAQDIGKMIRVDSYGYDNNNGYILMNRWQGWLPKKSVKLMKEVIWNH